MIRPREQIRTVTLRDGQRAVVIDCIPPDDAIDRLLVGLARRALVNGGGDCPCGARMPLPNRAQRRRGVVHVDIEHENDCPAVTGNLTAAVDAWEATL